jgi:hypothetical protein
MHLLAVLILLGLGAAGAWYALVDDVKVAFLGGLIAWAAAVIATFRGNFDPPADIPADVRMGKATLGYTGASLLLLGAGAVAAWYGLVEGFRIAFLGALLAWGAAVVLMFSGGAKPASEAVDRNDDATMQTIGLVALVVAAIAAGAAGVWYALVDDVKIGFALGLPVMAVATVTAFRGKLTA